MIQEDPLPTTAEDILNMADKYRNLDTGERFLVSAEQLTNDGGVALVYMSDFGRRTLSKSTDWFMDGTFKTVPEQFSQLYMVFGSGGESSRIYPSAYMLLPNKRSVTYTHALEILMRETNSAPISIAIDFEQAVIRASRNVFPNVAIQRCVFHWKKKPVFPRW